MCIKDFSSSHVTATQECVMRMHKVGGDYDRYANSEYDFEDESECLAAFSVTHPPIVKTSL